MKQETYILTFNLTVGRDRMDVVSSNLDQCEVYNIMW